MIYAIAVLDIIACTLICVHFWLTEKRISHLETTSKRHVIRIAAADRANYYVERELERLRREVADKEPKTLRSMS
jgi:hypothetical protein